MSMADLEIARKIALSQPDAEEFQHFDHPAFRIRRGKIFATLWSKDNRMMVKLTPIDQSVFHSFDPTIFFPVPNKWGLNGATFVELSKVRSDMLEDAIQLAWQTANSKSTKAKSK
jgi:hypothetical protein